MRTSTGSSWQRAPLGAALLLAITAGAGGCASVGDHLEALSADDNEDRAAAANALVEGLDEGDPAYSDRRPEIRAALTKALADPSPLVRQVAVAALAEVAGREAAGPLADRLRDKDPWVRYAAARALGDVGATSAREALESVLARDPDPLVRAEAARSLVGFGGEESLRPLYLGLGDAAAAVRHQCVQGLRKITGKDFGDDPRAWLEVIEAR